MPTKRPTPGTRSARGAEAARGLGLILLLAAAPAPARAQADTATWNAVGRVLKSPPAPAAGYVRYNFPRKDIALTVGDVSAEGDLVAVACRPPEVTGS